MWVVKKTDVQASLRTVRGMHLQTTVGILKDDEQQMMDIIATLIRQNGDRMIAGDLYQEVMKQVPMCYSKFRKRPTHYGNPGHN